MNNPEINEHEQIPSQQKESKVEKKENEELGAEILENPPDGSFLHGLKVFVAWVNNLLAKNDDK